MVEDHMTYALSVAEENISCYLLPRPWNLSSNMSHPLVLRRENWSAVVNSLLNTPATLS
jgi:hypothetical protein